MASAQPGLTGLGGFRAVELSHALAAAGFDWHHVPFGLGIFGIIPGGELFSTPAGPDHFDFYYPLTIQIIEFA